MLLVWISCDFLRPNQNKVTASVTSLKFWFDEPHSETLWNSQYTHLTTFKSAKLCSIYNAKHQPYVNTQVAISVFVKREGLSGLYWSETSGWLNFFMCIGWKYRDRKAHRQEFIWNTMGRLQIDGHLSWMSDVTHQNLRKQLDRQQLNSRHNSNDANCNVWCDGWSSKTDTSPTNQQKKKEKETMFCIKKRRRLWFFFALLFAP